MSGCEKYLEKIGEYIDNLLDRASEEEFLSHLDECQACRAEFDAEKALIKNIERMPVVDPGKEFTSVVMGRLFTPAVVRSGLLRRAFRRIDAFISKHRRLAWSPMVVASALAALYLPGVLETGTVGVLSTGSRVLTFMLNPLAGLITSLNRAIDIAGPLFRTLYLTIKVCAGFVYTLASMDQIFVVLVASVLIVMTTSLGIFLRVALEKRRAYNAELQI